MSIQLDDNYHIWKIKLQLAQQGNSQAIEDIKLQSTYGNTQFSFIENNLHDALKNSQIKFIKQSQTYGNYEMYTNVPIFLLLTGKFLFYQKGVAEVKCINLEGDQEILMKVEQKGVIYVSKDKIVSKFGESNANIVTKFHLVCSKNSILIEINEQSRRKIQSGQRQSPSLVGLREESIMKKYMLFPLKYIRIQDIDPKTSKCQEKFYLLQGRVCYYLQKGNSKERTLLTVYQEGYINPKQFTNTNPQIKLYAFENSKVLIFEEEFMRDDVIAALQSKRSEHLMTLIKAYEKMSTDEKKKIQAKLINNYKLNKKEVDKAVLGIVQPVVKEKEKEESFNKRISTKNDLISTSSSIKEKCRIRISKKKKII